MYAFDASRSQSVSPSRPASCLSGRIAIRLPPPLTQPVSVDTCGGVQRRLAEHDDVERAQQRRREERDVDRRERVQAFVPEDLAEVRRRTASRVERDDEQLRRRRLGRERPARRRRRAGSRRVLDAAAPPLTVAVYVAPYASAACGVTFAVFVDGVVGDRRRDRRVRRVLELERRRRDRARRSSPR